MYDNFDTDTWQRGLREQENSGQAQGWLTMREPSEDFFDQRRMRDLWSTGSVTHRPVSSALSRPSWGQPERVHPTISSRRRPMTSKDVWYNEYEKPMPLQIQINRPRLHKPVQLLPKYMLARESKNAVHAPPRSALAVTPRYKPSGERPEDVYSALVHPKHIPTLDLARAGLKSAPTNISNALQTSDTLRPVTQGGKRRIKMPILQPTTGADNRQFVSTATTEQRTGVTPRDLSCLPEPLQQALKENTGNVSSRHVSRTSSSNLNFLFTSQLVDDSFIVSEEHNASDGQDSSDIYTSVQYAPPTPVPKQRLTKRQHVAFYRSQEVLHCLEFFLFSWRILQLLGAN